MIESSRTDRRGHWPAGKRRGDSPIPAALRRKLDKALDHGDLTRRGIARALNLSDRSVRRWLSGEDWPSAAHLASLRRIVGPQG